ncbi:putative inactive histone-lysine N-methyltransferase SUVR2 isoform X2 [Tasmannia lanceolata]|uniref:putative inactive histone-lysine N-methyltransferase SUVR2 isoform X2 n=1 Tax=Tasmannia lanceolata TaxID=3420 RepID=UPI004063B032
MSRSRASLAFEAMKAIEIPPQIVKPVLKNLLQVFDKNWEIIEAENYRLLADAIFDSEDSKREEEARKKESKKIDIVEDKKKETSMYNEPEPPRTRSRLRQEDGQSSGSLRTSTTAFGEMSSKRPKYDEAVSPQICPRHEQAELVSPQIYVQEKRTNPVSPQAYLKEKVTEALSPQVAAREKRVVSERISNTSCFKEPKIEPGIDLLPKQNVPTRGHYNALIKPKSEPFTGDFPEFEIPIAVIHPPVMSPHRDEAHPDPVCEESVAAGNDSTGQADAPQSLASENVDKGDGTGDGVIDKEFNSGTRLEIVTVPEAAHSNIEIASSTTGEVKLSLTCNSALGRSDFHMPSLDAVLKLVEDKCLRSYKILEPSFSLMKLMEDVCQCAVELGTDSSDDRQRRYVNITPTLDFLKKSNIEDVWGAKSDQLHGKFNFPGSSSNGSPDSHTSSEVVPKLLALNGLHRSMHSKGETSENLKNERKKKQKEREDSEFQKLNSRSLVAGQQCQFFLDDVKPLHDVNDISKGEERVRISLVNESSSVQYPPSFYYIPQNIVYQNAYVNFSLARIGDEDCCADCFGDCLSLSIPCACARETGGEYAYTLDGLVKEEFLNDCISMNCDPQKKDRLFYCKDCPLERSKNEVVPDSCKGHLVRKFIKECWSKCGCNKQCGNRVVQRGITCNLQVFFTQEGKGWGVRTLEELPRGAFVCEYVGEVLTNMELYDRNIQSTGNEKHTYPVLLDADWGSEGVLKDEEALCLDATFYGNVARFINHRCSDANLVEIPVEVETPDHHYYHLAFFTTKKVEALEELTWDYGIDFNDHNHPVKAFRCCCGSKFCRDMKHPGRTKQRSLVLR